MRSQHDKLGLPLNRLDARRLDVDEIPSVGMPALQNAASHSPGKRVGCVRIQDFAAEHGVLINHRVNSPVGVPQFGCNPARKGIVYESHNLDRDFRQANHFDDSATRSTSAIQKA